MTALEIKLAQWNRVRNRLRKYSNLMDITKIKEPNYTPLDVAGSPDRSEKLKKLRESGRDKFKLT